MRSIRQIKNPKGKIILLRAGFDVPIENGRVIDSKRIEILLPTIKYLLKKGPLVILSHQGRPKGRRDMNFTQQPLILVLEKLLQRKIKFAERCVGAETEKMAKSLRKGEILLLENLRFEPGEEKNDPIFAKKLARLGDIYVADAFPDAHRKHASIVSVPKYLPSYAGFQFLKEVKYLSLVFKKTKYPFLLILGGAKFETKIPLIKKYLKLADYVFIGGALANNFLKARGYEIGRSLCERGNFGIEPILKNKKLILPVDVLVKNDTNSAMAEFVSLKLKKINEVRKEEAILDIGRASVDLLKPYIQNSRLILWNGPLGKYEAGGGGSTEKILKAVASSRAESIIGGGDTVNLISKLKLEKKFTFISTGGGAALEFLANGILPGIKALK